jgi:hypothetical protein
LREGVRQTVQWYLERHAGDRQSRFNERLLMERN